MLLNEDKIIKALETAKGIAWDECHKIYVLMDNEQMVLMESLGYDPLIKAEDTTPEDMLNTLEMWYEDSCSLKFINSVSTNPSNPNAGFVDLIAQGEGWEDEEDDSDIYTEEDN